MSLYTRDQNGEVRWCLASVYTDRIQIYCLKLLIKSSFVLETLADMKYCLSLENEITGIYPIGLYKLTTKLPKTMIDI